MKKGSKLRGAVPMKVLAFLLALAAAVCLCASAGGALYLYSNYRADASFNVMYNRYYTVDGLEGNVREYLFLYLHKDALTAAGQARYNELAARLDEGNTNFRFSVTAYGNGALGEVVSNDSSGAGTADAETWESETVSGYDLGRDRMIYHYLVINQSGDWEVRRGTVNEWASTSFASAYYYTELGSEAEGYDYFDDYAEDTEPLEQAEDAGPEYFYFVYTGDFTTYELCYWVDTTYPVEDDIKLSYDTWLDGQAYYQAYNPILVSIAMGSLLVFVALLVWLTWSVGWNQMGELALRGVNRIPAEWVLLGAAGIVTLAVIWFAAVGWYGSLLSCMFTFGVVGGIGGFGCLAAWLILAVQLKTRTLLERSLCWRLLRWCRRMWSRLRKWAGEMMEQWPLYWKVGVFFAAYLLVYLLYMFRIALDAVWSYGGGLLAIIFVALPMLPLAGYACKWALDWAKLRKSVEEMVAGKLDYTVDTAHMLPDLKDHGEELGRLSAGLSRAVEERVKGQRFKTELITNVSHDLKTPLTSIINYVDLLKKADIQDETVRGYIEVLDRKSQRLKTLTEDLVEASKAASGTIAVNLERLDMNQLVEQAVAEYDERLELAGLTPIVKLPKEPCMVLADGRHVWRVLDNLLGNCTKYAMPGTRVYLDVTEGERRCTVTVKNISADPLNVPAEELLKRFVRGDSARSTEGSGLGLSIARNLTTAQGGSFDLVVDGDLFKAIVTLPLAGPEKPEPTPAPQRDRPEPDAGRKQEVPLPRAGKPADAGTGPENAGPAELEAVPPERTEEKPSPGPDGENRPE